MCKNITKAMEFSAERMASASDISESLKEVYEADENNEIGSLIVKIEASRKSSEKMKVELANMLLQKVTDYVWSDSLAYFENGGE